MTRPRVTSGPVDDIGATISDLQSRIRNLETVGHQHPTAPVPTAWQNWTPRLVQSGNVAATINFARYIWTGWTCTAQCFLTVTGAGAAATVQVYHDGTLPGQAQTNIAVGVGLIYDVSTPIFYQWVVRQFSGYWEFVRDGSNQSATIPTLAANDVLRFTATFETTTVGPDF